MRDDLGDESAATADEDLNRWPEFGSNRCMCSLSVTVARTVEPLCGWIRASVRMTIRPPSGVWPCTKESAPSSSTRSMVTGRPSAPSVRFSGRTPKTTSLRPFSDASASSSRGSGTTVSPSLRALGWPAAGSAGSSTASP